MAEFSISRYILRGVITAYGLVCLIAFAIMALSDGAAFRRASRKEQDELSTAREHLWALSKTPFGVKHQFFTLKDGRKLHYVVAGEANTGSSLVVCLHGFPDSWVLWHGLLSSKLVQHCVLVAVDLPGHGGSDDLPNYSPDAVLEAITQFILGMRELYAANEEHPEGYQRVLLVAHDWGTTIAFRLASEAPQLADRFIVSNSVHPPLALSNIKGRYSSSLQLLKAWTRQPRSLNLLRSAASTLSPVLNQVKKSGYVFVFNLPAPLANSFGALGNYWFLRLAHASARGKRRIEGPEAAEHLASSLGPGVEQCRTGPSQYPPSVAQRARSGGWSTKIRLYREGLATQPWHKTPSTLQALQHLSQQRGTAPARPSGADALAQGPPGALLAPTTVVWGARDVALDGRIALDGVRDYLCAGGQVVLLARCGHWVPCDGAGVGVLEEAVRWAAEGGEAGALGERVERFAGVQVWVER